MGTPVDHDALPFIAKMGVRHLVHHVGIVFARTQDDGTAYAYADVRVANCLVENNTGMTEKNTPTGSYGEGTSRFL